MLNVIKEILDFKGICGRMVSQLSDGTSSLGNCISTSRVGRGGVYALQEQAMAAGDGVI